MPSRASEASESQLPSDLKSLFWDCDFQTLDLSKHHNFIIRRILDRGDTASISWLRKTLGDDAIREWFLAKHGGGLEIPRR